MKHFLARGLACLLQLLFMNDISLLWPTDILESYNYCPCIGLFQQQNLSKHVNQRVVSVCKSFSFFHTGVLWNQVTLHLIHSHKPIYHHLVNANWLRAKWLIDHCPNKLPKSCVINILPSTRHCVRAHFGLKTLISVAHTDINMKKNCLKNMPLYKILLWCDLNVTVWCFSPCICLSLFCMCWEDAYSGAVFYLFLVCNWSCFCTLVVGNWEKKTCWFGAFFCTAKSSHPSPSLLSLSLSVSLSPYMLTKFMHAYGVRCRQGCWYNRFVSSLCFKAPPVNFTACHFRQIFQSVTFLQKWNHRTLWE